MKLTDLKIAVTGATGAFGHAVRTVLAERNVQPENVRLLEHVSDEALISEYAGQATLVEPLDQESLARQDLVLLCGSAEESASCLIWERKKGSLIVDLSGAAAGRRDVPLVNASVNAGSLSKGIFVVAAPQPISFALTTALAPIERACGIERAEVVVLRPASDFGEKGIEELHVQTVSLLNFKEIPKPVFGRQTAFNVLPQTVLDGTRHGEGLDARLAWEIDRVFGWTAPRTTVRILLAPVFHGHAALIHLHLSGAAPIQELRSALGRSPGLSLEPTKVPMTTPVEIARQADKLVVNVTADGLDSPGLWLWVVGADLYARAAQNAIEIAGQVLCS